jgi:hypothetical protein
VPSDGTGVDLMVTPRDIERSINRVTDQARAKGTLLEVPAKVQRHIKNTYLKSVQVPLGIKPVLKAWMELS